jgi:hypothetical protein
LFRGFLARSTGIQMRQHVTSAELGTSLTK